MSILREKFTLILSKHSGLIKGLGTIAIMVACQYAFAEGDDVVKNNIINTKLDASAEEMKHLLNGNVKNFFYVFWG